MNFINLHRLCLCEEGMYSAIALLFWLNLLCSSFLSINSKIFLSKLPILSFPARKLIQIRGGSTASVTSNLPTKTVLVSTSIGTSFLDKKKKFVLNNDATIKDLKHLIHKKFPGSPPVEMQDLYYGGILLEDSQLCSNVTSIPTVSIILDMITGTAGYNKTLSVREAVEAYAASVVHLTYIGDKMKSAMIPTDTNTSPKAMQTLYYRQLFETVNASVYEKYHAEIQQALEDEKDPEYYITDKYAWRNPDQQPMNPLTAAIAKEFDLNWNGVKNFVFYSFITIIFAVGGTQTKSSYNLLLSVIPFMWISKLRQLRLLYKIALYIFLPLTVAFDFLLPLLPAPYQVIALQHAHWFGSSTADTVSTSSMDEEQEDEELIEKAKEDDELDGEEQVDDDEEELEEEEE